MAKRARPGGGQVRPTKPDPAGTAVEEAALVAERLAVPTSGLTGAGLPLRVPKAHLVPGAFSGDEPAPARRSADEVRDRLDDYQEGVRRARQSVAD